MIINSIFVVPEPRRFGADAEKALAAELTQLERVTSVKHVSGAGELCLDREGRLPGGYRYTEAAFKQVCSLAARGLYQLVIDLSGIYRQTGTLRNDYSFDGAVDLFNAVVRRRFRGRFDGKARMVRNTDQAHRLVDGVLGPKYNYLENRTVYDMAKDAVASGPVRVRFHEAALAGRRIAIRFAHRAPLFEIPLVGHGVESFYGGYHFSNSEIAGEASVKAAILLLRQPSDTIALGKFGKGRLAHTGKDFGKKLNKMFQAVLSIPQDAKTLRERVEAIREAGLGLGGTEQERDDRLEYIALMLHRQDIPKSLAGRIAVSAMNYGSYDVVGKPRMLTREVLGRRTVYDLYTALTREAKELPLSVRESVEQAAYGLLNGKIKLR
jgi:hypothetical protein